MIQDDQSQYTINKTLQRLQQDSDKGSVNITGLPAGEYSVRVYDDYNVHILHLKFPCCCNSLIHFHKSVSSTHIELEYTTGKHYYTYNQLLLFPFPHSVPNYSSPSPVQSPSQHKNINNNNTIIILATSITTGLLLLQCDTAICGHY